MLHRDELEKGRDEGARRTVGETRVEKEQWCSAELLQLKVDVRRDPKRRRRFERYYDQLVDEMISNDLAIRARVEKVELLIFPSTMLPSQYKRFQSKYYLWGIFKRKQAASTIKDS
ncbi:hypothetical protein P8452_22330 [Trifolium repens]|nr:hypothetical protein P8452_22330 [Trifolium repens]